MAGNVTFKLEGIQEFKALIKEMQEDFDEKDQKKILNGAVKKSMSPVLSTAKSLVPIDTGGLRASLRLEVRKPNRKDRRSQYVSTKDAVIGTVTTAPGNVLAKLKYKNAKTGKKTIGVQSDARAIANEFGTADMGAKPYLRPALESQSSNVVNTLGQSLREVLEKYRSKQAKKG
jgi:HK97 gp10 family phage protein